MISLRTWGSLFRWPQGSLFQLPFPGYLSPLDFERLRETASADGDRFGEALEPAGRVASGAPAPAGVVIGVAAGNTGRA